MRGVPALSVVPAGTTIDLKITLPRERGGGSEILRWVAPETMEAASVRVEIAKDLVPKFFAAFLPKDE